MYAANVDRLREQHRQYYLTHTHHHRRRPADRSPDTVAPRKARQAARDSARIAKNPGEWRARARDWQRRNPDRVLSNNAARRARRRGATLERVDFAIVAERDRWTCGLCGEPVGTDRGRSDRSVSLDHITPLALGGEHSYANVQLAHLGCNRRKGARVEVAA